MNSKGDLSMNMIIIAAISLLVLAIIAYLVFGASDNVNNGTSCKGLGGTCEFSQCSGTAYPIHNMALDGSCKAEGGVCCMKMGTS